MPTVETNKEAKIPPFRIPKEGLAGWRKLYEILRFIFAKIGYKLSFDGLEGQEIPGGIHIKAIPGTTATENFIVTATTTTTGSPAFRVSAGTYNGVVPTLAGTSLDAATAPIDTLGTSGAYYVYLKLTYTLTATSSGYVYGTSLSSAVIEGRSTVASSPLGPSTSIFRVLLATFSNGLKTAQHISTSLTGEVCDDGSGTSKGNLTTYQT